MMDLTTNYLGLRLKNPLVASASPLSREVDNVRRLQDAGLAAVVLYSLFQEQIDNELAAHDHFETLGTHSFPEALTYTPSLDYLPQGSSAYVDHLASVKDAVDIPVIASINGTTLGGWIDHAKRLEDAGADALELNIYELATDPAVAAGAVEDRYAAIVKAVKSTVSIPVALKIGPYFSSLAHFARRLDREGVDGLVLFNRFYQPDIELEELDVVPDITLSAPHELRLPLRWIAILDPIVDASLAATTGVYGAYDVLKLLMAGADVTMLCATLLRNGAGRVRDILDDMVDWMQEHEYESVHQLQGSMNHRACPNPAAFERANYMQALHSYI